MLEKVRALLNKADPSNGATPAESASFMAKAQELMLKHGIEQLEAMTTGNESCFNIGRTDCETGRGRRNADTYVAAVIKACFGVDVVWTTYYHGNKMGGSLNYAIMGDEADRQMAKIAIPVIYKTMISGLSEWLRAKGIKWTAAIERSFCHGVREGYLKASEEGKQFVLSQLSKEQKEAFGLIVVQKEGLIKSFKDKEFPELRQTRIRKGVGSAAATAAGFGKGAAMKLSQTHNID